MTAAHLNTHPPLRPVKDEMTKAERNTRILELWDNGNGMEVEEICKEFGIRKTTVYDVIKPRKNGNSDMEVNVQKPETKNRKPENTEKLERQISELQTELKRLQAEKSRLEDDLYEALEISGRNVMLLEAAEKANAERGIELKNLESRIFELQNSLTEARSAQAEDLRKNRQDSEKWEADKREIHANFQEQLAYAQKLAQQEIETEREKLELERKRLESEFREKLQLETLRNSELLENAGKRHAETAELFQEFRSNSEAETGKLELEISELTTQLETYRNAEKNRKIWNRLSGFFGNLDIGKFLLTNKNVKFILGLIGVSVQSWVFASLYVRIFTSLKEAIPFEMAYAVGFICEFAGLMVAGQKLESESMVELEEMKERRNWILGIFLIFQLVIEFSFLKLFGENSNYIGSWLLGSAIPFMVLMYFSLWLNAKKISK